MYSFGTLDRDDVAARRPMHEPPLHRPALRLVPDDVERLPGVLRTRARAGRRSSSSGARSCGCPPWRRTAGRRAKSRWATSAGSSSRRPRVGSGTAGPRRGSRRRTARREGGRGPRPDSGSSRRASSRARHRSARTDRAPTRPRRGGRRDSRPRRGRGRSLPGREARRRGSSGVRPVPRPLRYEVTFAQVTKSVTAFAPPVSLANRKRQVESETGRRVDTASARSMNCPR